MLLRCSFIVGQLGALSVSPFRVNLGNSVFVGFSNVVIALEASNSPSWRGFFIDFLLFFAFPSFFCANSILEHPQEVILYPSQRINPRRNSERKRKEKSLFGWKLCYYTGPQVQRST